MNERYCPRCGRFKALSAPLCDRCIEPKKDDEHRCPKCGGFKSSFFPVCTRCEETERLNSTDAHKCPKCGKYKFIFQPLCYDCKLLQSSSIVQSEIEYVDVSDANEPTVEHAEYADDQTTTGPMSYTDFHRKYGDMNIYKCKSGIYVKSKDERTIADFLYENNIPFQYEQMTDYYAYDINTNMIQRREIYPDFFIKGPVTFQGRRIENVYIEYWGMDTPEYLEKQAYKRNVYKNHNCTLISLYPEDLYDAESNLTMKLTRFIDRQLNY